MQVFICFVSKGTPDVLLVRLISNWVFWQLNRIKPVNLSSFAILPKSEKNVQLWTTRSGKWIIARLNGLFAWYFIQSGESQSRRGRSALWVGACSGNGVVSCFYGQGVRLWWFRSASRAESFLEKNDGHAVNFTTSDKFLTWIGILNGGHKSADSEPHSIRAGQNENRIWKM